MIVRRDRCDFESIKRREVDESPDLSGVVTMTQHANGQVSIDAPIVGYYSMMSWLHSPSIKDCLAEIRSRLAAQTDLQSQNTT